MSLDLQLLASKLVRYRQQFQATVRELSEQTGIPEDRLSAYEEGKTEPTGDHILILADFYKCDYRFFLSNEKLASFEQTETLFRIHGNDLSKDDRWAIQEFLFLCECEEFLLNVTHGPKRLPFSFSKTGGYFKAHGEQAAAALRRHLGYVENAVGMNVFEDFRRIGLHVFRRVLQNSGISGLFVRHPTAGLCVLVNYSEDPYRQRFTAAHEAGHAILDDDKDVVVSFSQWDKSDLSEIRANTFASHYLMSPPFLSKIPDLTNWPPDKSSDWANRLKVSTSALARALKSAGLVDAAQEQQIKAVKVPSAVKRDAELPESLSPNSLARKQDLLRRGLSDYYVTLCLNAYEQGQISGGRLAEMLLVSEQELAPLATLYGRSLAYAD